MIFLHVFNTFCKTYVSIKICILAGLECFLGPLEPILGRLGAILGGLGCVLGLPLLPQRPRNKTRGETVTLPRPTENLPKFTSFFFSFSAPSWARLGSLLGSILAPSWAPFGLNFGPSRLLTPYFVKKVYVHKTLTNPR